MKTNTTRKKLIESCKAQLLDTKRRHLEKLHALSTELVKEASGDVADQARELQEETMSLAQRGKLAIELEQIDAALERIKNNSYGICEETGAPIEDKRLIAIPWTRLSLEGAEIRELEEQEVG